MSQATDDDGDVDYDTQDVMFETLHDWSGPQCVSVTIALALEQTTDIDLMDGGKTLNDYVDTDALDSIFSHGTDGIPRDSVGKVTIHIEEYKVEVHSSGTIQIRNIKNTEH